MGLYETDGGPRSIVLYSTCETKASGSLEVDRASQLEAGRRVRVARMVSDAKPAILVDRCCVNVATAPAAASATTSCAVHPRLLPCGCCVAATAAGWNSHFCLSSEARAGCALACELLGRLLDVEADLEDFLRSCAGNTACEKRTNTHTYSQIWLMFSCRCRN